MVLQAVERDKKRDHKRWGYRLYPMANTFSGIGGSRFVNCTAGGDLSTTSGTQVTLVSNTGTLTHTDAVTVTQVVIVRTSGVADEYKYDPEMVARILRIDAEAPEAVFDNFKDMMDWLDRD